jgi:hypothetical protein
MKIFEQKEEKLFFFLIYQKMRDFFDKPNFYSHFYRVQKCGFAQPRRRQSFAGGGGKAWWREAKVGGDIRGESSANQK